LKPPAHHGRKTMLSFKQTNPQKEQHHFQAKPFTPEKYQ
jgi:hypothetical protein